MKKILVLATGGTIASKESAEGLAPGLTGEEILRLAGGMEGAQLSVRELFSLDSTNIAPEHQLAMGWAIAEGYEDFDGFLILHGTDTLAYTAAALSLRLKNLKKPVVLTGSQLPAEAEGSDAADNVRLALLAALSGRAGVMVAFGGLVLPGCAARKAYTHDFRAFISVNAAPLAHLGGEGLVWEREMAAPAGEFSFESALERRVAVLKITPGLSPLVLRAMVDAGLKGLILEGYGLGDIPGAAAKDSLLDAIEYAIAQGCRVYCATQCLYEGTAMDTYEVGRSAKKLGIVEGGSATVETLLARAMLELA